MGACRNIIENALRRLTLKRHSHRWAPATCQSRALSVISRGPVYDVIDPANGEKVGEVPEDSAEMVAEKFETAAGGQRRWRRTPIEQRQAAMLRFAQLLMADTERLASIMTSEMGKPITQARNEVRATGLRIRYFVENAHKVLEPQTMMQTPKMTERVTYEPLGVIANISAWNYPYFVSANVFGAALMTGNSVLFKPSEHASLSGLAMTQLLHRAGVPEDVFVTTTGRGETGAAVASLPELGGLFFTGSNRTGQIISRHAASNLVKVQLELGGKDPVYVRRDVPSVAAAAAALADGAFYNAGQSCCSVERIYVDKAVYAPFLEEFLKTVRSFKVGDPREADTYIGPLARQPQLAVLQSQVADALAKGARAALGGEASRAGKPGGRSAGNYFHPAVLTDVDHSMAVMREESFGPIVGIQAVESDEEAVALMGDTGYGLTAGVYCQHREEAEAILHGVTPKGLPKGPE